MGTLEKKEVSYYFCPDCRVFHVKPQPLYFEHLGKQEGQVKTQAENHSAHVCIDEYVGRLKSAADTILITWRAANLPCNAIKGWQITNGIGEGVAGGPAFVEAVRILEEIAESLSIELPEPEIDDTVHYCPECETPNQFGELCLRCQREIGEEENQN